jgi:trehalose 2-sulfotransferase
MHLYEDQFSEGHDFPRVDKPSKILIIASTGRCGSHMLGHALHETGSFGFPLEYTNPANLIEWKKRLGIEDFHAVLTEIQQRRTSPNGVFGIKIHYSHIKQFGGFNHLIEYLPKAYYILLSRKNVLSQAVSLSIARQTGVWISVQKPVKNNPKYNFKHIDKCLRQIILENSAWRYILAASGCNYIEMDFDYVRNNLAKSIERISSFINVKVDPRKVPKEQVTKKQGNYINEKWAIKFLSDFNKSDELLPNKRPDFVYKIKAKLKEMIQA